MATKSKKSAIITSVMKHPKLSADLKAALKSPLGSSARRKAFLNFKTLKAVNRISSPRIQRFSGRGGPGYFGQGGPLVIPSFSTTQTPTFQTASMADTAQVLQTPTMPVSSNYLFIPDPTKPSAKAVITPPALSPLSPWATSATSITPAPTAAQPTAGAQMPGFTPWNQIMADVDADIAATKKAAAPVAPSLKPPVPAAPTAPAAPAAAPAAPAQPTGVTTLPVALPGTPEYAAQVAQLQAADTTGAADTTDTAGMPQDLIKQAVQAGIGPSAFRYMMMSDTKKLAELTGAPIESLPSGPSLSKIVNDLTATLQKESGLQGQLAELSKRTATGAGLEKQLTDYVTTRDSYISDVDGMINNIKAQALTRDMADPSVQAEVNNNLNYLYTLKSRQIKRYGDFVKDSFDIYNNQTTQLKNAYIVAKDTFDTALASKTAIAKEDFQNWSDMLEEMYTAEKNVEDNFYAKANQKLKYDTAMGTLAGNAVDGYGSGYSIPDMKRVPEVISTIGTQETYQKPGGTASEKLTVTNANIGDAMKLLSQYTVGEGATPRKADPTAVVNALAAEMNTNMQYALYNTADFKGSSMLSTYMKRLLEYWNQEGNTATVDPTTGANIDQATSDKTRKNAQVLMDAMSKGFNKALDGSIGSDPVKLKAVQDAIEDLVINKSWFGLKQKPRTAEEVQKNADAWFTKHSKTVDSTILRAIAGYFDVAASATDPATGKPLGGDPYNYLPLQRDPADPTQYLKVNGMRVSTPPSQLSVLDIQQMVDTGLFWELNKNGF